MELTEEQKARIARNKEIARQRLEERNKRLALESAPTPTTSSNASSSNNSSDHWFSKPQHKIASMSLNSTSYNKPVQRTENFPPPVHSGYMSTVNIQFFIQNRYRIKIAFKPFHTAIVEAIKTLNSKQYIDTERCWTFNFCEYYPLMLKLRGIRNLRLEIEELPVGVKKVFQDDLAGKPVLYNDVSLDMLDSRLVDLLFPYQKEGVKYGIQRGGRLLIADEMGLGKSIQALAIAQNFSKEWPLLIICPSSVKCAWKQQIEKFLPNPTDVFIMEKTSTPLPIGRSTTIVVIMSYDLMKIRAAELKQHSFYVIIFDESHFLKDLKTQRTKAAIDLSSKATRVILLSGTPALSRPVELFSQIRIINAKIFPNFMEFARRYCDGRDGRFQFEAKGATNTDELSAILEKTIMIRRLKRDVLHDLPDKRREIIYLSGGSIDSKMDAIKEARKAFLKASGSTNTSLKNESLMGYFVETGNVKAQAVTSYIIENYFYEGAESRKILLFAHHQVVLDTLEINIKKKGIKYIRIDGTTNSTTRFNYCEAFQNDPEVMVAILSITAAGIGITLTAASIVVFAELHWNPGFLSQAEDRAHRVGQKDSVMVKYILAKNTADDDIFPLIQKKLKILSSVNLSNDSYKDAANIHRDCTDRAITNYLAKINKIPDLANPVSSSKEENDSNDENKLEEIEEPELKRPKSNVSIIEL